MKSEFKKQIERADTVHKTMTYLGLLCVLDFAILCLLGPQAYGLLLMYSICGFVVLMISLAVHEWAYWKADEVHSKYEAEKHAIIVDDFEGIVLAESAEDFFEDLRKRLKELYSEKDPYAIDKFLDKWATVRHELKKKYVDMPRTLKREMKTKWGELKKEHGLDFKLDLEKAKDISKYRLCFLDNHD
ncbi:MAG TPA: hypothetical protein EYP46_03940 [Hadesarchaea archaeon]|nr:hypothetical protein [Hadesarchaea archaeon]